MTAASTGGGGGGEGGRGGGGGVAEGGEGEEGGFHHLQISMTFPFSVVGFAESLTSVLDNLH